MYALGARNSTLDESNAACSDTQTGKQSWGQSRTTRTKGTGDYEHEKTWGKNVKVYVIDTGSNCNHEDFNAACSCGPTFSGGTNGCSDGNGHGTHCASTATGTVYGISKNAELVGVKVLGDSGSGSTSGVIAGMDWVASQGSGSVASMSLGGGYSSASNNAVDGMTRAGVTVVVAAGNDGRDACNYSPASASTAYTIGATTQSDARSSFSNIGKCVDIFAPGSSITAAWYKPGQTNTISGTSMACPHVAGAAAAILSENPRFTPAEVKSALDNLALTGVISNVGANSPNKFLHLEC
jgi:subtilisin family serine protease